MCIILIILHLYMMENLLFFQHVPYSLVKDGLAVLCAIELGGELYEGVD